MTTPPSKEDFRKLIANINAAADEITSKLKTQSDIISSTSKKVEEINSALNSKRLSLESQMAKAIEEGNEIAFAALKANYDQLQNIQSRISGISNTEIISDTDATRMTNTLDSILSGIKGLGTKPGDLPVRNVQSGPQRPGIEPLNWQQELLVAKGGKKRNTKRRRKRGGYTYKGSPTRRLVTKSKRRRKHKTHSRKR